MVKRILSWMVILAMAFALIPAAHAEGAEAGTPVKVKVSGTGYTGFSFLTDGNTANYKTSSGSCTMTVQSQEKFGSLYLMFDLEYAEYTLTDNESGQTVTAGQYGFLHEYIPLPQPTSSVTITFSSGAVRLSEISAYTPGAVPEGVQVWQPPLEGKTDILLLATHGDDDQLYFAGLFPLYAAERGYGVQVAYLTDHRNLTNVRTHEMLNGLWATGITAYPVFGSFPDFRIDDLKGSYQEFARQGVTEDQLQAFVVEQLRRFDPMVVVGHDFAGEYGHGMHQVYTDLLVKALDIANDPSQYPESAQAYGVWDVPKTYIHLYETDPIVIDYDTPLESFGGLTAFQVTQQYGFPCHVSQQRTMFHRWIYGSYGEITKASQIEKYNPCNFGLFRSTVGADVQKNDFMENVVCYEEQARQEAERQEAERLEAERLEAERLEAERQEAQRQEAERQEAERQAAERERQRQEQIAKAKKEKQERMTIGITSVSGLLLLLIAVMVIPGIVAGRKRKKE